MLFEKPFSCFKIEYRSISARIPGRRSILREIFSKTTILRRTPTQILE
jgi:hypothetical protein